MQHHAQHHASQDPGWKPGPRTGHEPTLEEHCDAARAHLRVARLAAAQGRDMKLVRREIQRARSEIRIALAIGGRHDRPVSARMAPLVHLADHLRSLSVAAAS